MGQLIQILDNGITMTQTAAAFVVQVPDICRIGDFDLAVYRSQGQQVL